jgi:pimeloyl-ACP methyl ester carboxylesterase
VKKLRVGAVLVVAATLAGLLLVGVQPASAEAAVTCTSNIGTKVPVLMVHGFNSNPGMWNEGGEASMRSALEKDEGVKVVDSFDYKETHFNWVTDSAIGPKLAKTIDCLAQSSRKGGGAGKVIVVAHSMGGLATRYAASQTIDGRKVADELGLVITLGTPNAGSPLANTGGLGLRYFCAYVAGVPNLNLESEVNKCLGNSAVIGMTEGSQALRDLPEFPANVPVRAIAGQVQIFTQFFFGSISQQLDSDLVVPVQSATAEYTNKGRGDGRFVFRCDIRHYDSYGDPTKYQGGQCSHNEMYKTRYIQESVTNGIRDYLATARNTCLSASEAGALLVAKYGPESAGLERYLSIVCDSEWAVVHDNRYDGYALFQLIDGKWTYAGSGSYWEGDHPDLCARVTKPIHDLLSC